MCSWLKLCKQGIQEIRHPRSYTSQGGEVINQNTAYQICTSESTNCAKLEMLVKDERAMPNSPSTMRSRSPSRTATLGFPNRNSSSCLCPLTNSCVQEVEPWLLPSSGGFQSSRRTWRTRYFLDFLVVYLSRIQVWVD